MAAPGQVINMQLMLVCLIGVGVLTTKLGIIPEGARGPLSQLVIMVVLPCNILSSFMVSYSAQLLARLGMMLAVGLGIQLFCLGLNTFIWNRQTPPRQKVLKYSTLVSNAGFLGNPVVEGIYGAEGLVYASAYLVPLRIMMWSVGLGYFTATTLGKTVKKLLTHPCIIATVLGLVLLVTGWRPPVFITDTVGAIGRTVTVLSMLVIGNILGSVPLKSLVSPLALGYSLLRLVLIPLAVLGVLLLLRPGAVTMGVAVVLAGMPAGGTGALLAQQYGGDAAFASKLVFVSTLLSLVTIPLWSFLVSALAG